MASKKRNVRIFLAVLLAPALSAIIAAAGAHVCGWNTNHVGRVSRRGVPGAWQRHRPARSGDRAYIPFCIRVNPC